jgi:hypothetical protein
MYYNALRDLFGGEGGIRTPDTVARMPHFECGAIDHSATSPSNRYLSIFRFQFSKIRLWAPVHASV